MKTAVVYDYLPAIGGGAERSLLDLIEHFGPDVDIFFGFVVDSSFSREYLKELRKRYTPSHVHVGPTVKFLKPFVFRIMNYLLPALLQNMPLQSFDLVVSYTAFLSHAIIPPVRGKHVLYMNTPARFLWNLSHAQSLLKKVTSAFFITNIFQFFYRLYDLDAIRATKKIIAISQAIKTRIKTYYDRDVPVVYPASISDELLASDYVDPDIQRKIGGNYFIHVSRIESYKNIDLLIDLATQHEIPEKIVIIGDGPYRRHLIQEATTKLKGKAHTQNINFFGYTAIQIGNLIFTGYMAEELKFRLMTNASAFFALNDEDFGISKIESLAVGTPVIGLAAGATPEIIHHGQNGLLFEDATAESLFSVLQLHKKLSYDREMIRKTAKPFTISEFHTNLDKVLNA